MKIYRIIGAEGRITIPYILRQIIGFRPADVVSFEIIGENTIRICREQLADRDVPGQSLTRVPELMTYLERLSANEQFDVLVHLSVLWAENQNKQPEKGGEM